METCVPPFLPAAASAPVPEPVELPVVVASALLADDVELGDDVDAELVLDDAIVCSGQEAFYTCKTG